MDQPRLDEPRPLARASTVGVYRFWRDAGYVAGGLIAGGTADALGFSGAIAVVAGLTAASGLWGLLDLPAGTPPAPDPLRPELAASAGAVL